ncbi:MAG: peptidase S14 [Comamonadaceae bacterium]|nr:MAG: peptidase S14 [Comamonadaceae bacterium]
MPSNSLPSLSPDIRLFGNVGEDMLSEFFRQQSEIKPGSEPLVFELSTSGGDADMGRRIADEIRLWQREREVYFLGKTFVFSAGVTIMAAFPPSRRFMTAGCEILIHERKMKKNIHLEGALRGCRSLLLDALAEVDSGQRLERAGFESLVEGTPLTAEDVQRQVLDKDWYLTAEEAVKTGLIAGVI